MGTFGLTAERAGGVHGEDVHEYRADFRDILHALADMPQRSLFKLVCTGPERRVVGINLLGEAADEILQGFAVALTRGITLDDLRDTVAHPPPRDEELVPDRKRVVSGKRGSVRGDLGGRRTLKKNNTP